MAPLGPFEPAPLLAVAVSGGADSMALALLVRDWARARGGDVVALVVDHGLRVASGAEAGLTIERLAALGIVARRLTLSGLAHGPGLARRAREARYGALLGACGEAGILHLLLGHHAADQAETVIMRRGSGSGALGLAGMPGVVETETARLLRPLLGVAPAALRALLRAADVGWVEDPSNRDPAATRARLRSLRADQGGVGPATRALGEAARARGRARAAAECAMASVLARRARIHPEGFVLLTGGPIAPLALAALLRMVGGRAHMPPAATVAALARAPRPATLGGVRLLPAGRHGPPGALLLVREEAAMAPAGTASAFGPGESRDGSGSDSQSWDGRFRLIGTAERGALVCGRGKGGPRRLDRAGARLTPAAARWAMPALSVAESLFPVPLFGYSERPCGVGVAAMLRPRAPVCPAFFVPAAPRGAKALRAAYVQGAPPAEPLPDA